MKDRVALVVDDNDDIRELIGEALGAAGFLVIAARNGFEAFEKLACTYAPDVVVLDLMMPVMDGWQLRDRIRELLKFKQVPVIAVSASSFGRASHEGFDGFLPKPFEASELVALVERALGAKTALAP